MVKNTFPDIYQEIRVGDSFSLKEFQKKITKKHVIIDMGCGHGDFLIERTQEHPDHYFVGIEISRKRVFKTSHRLSKRNIKNFAVIDSEGELALKLLFPDNSVDEIHINFPDPWLRKRQWKNRIFKPSFLIQAVRVLKSNGSLYFVTDVREYAEQVGTLLSEFPLLKNNYDNLIEINIYDGFPTLFYRKMSPLRDINYLNFIKTDS